MSWTGSGSLLVWVAQIVLHSILSSDVRFISQRQALGERLA